MKPEAVASAEEALRRAKAALSIIRRFGVRPLPGHYPRILEAWADLLAYGNRVYGKLERGAKRGPADSWFAAIKGERESDPMLRYLHEARNVDDHGITAIVDPKAGFIEAAIPPEGLILSSRSGLAADLDIMPGQPGSKRVAALLPVDCRDGTIGVPHEHLGRSIDDSNPLTLGELFVERLEAIVSEARAWLPPSP